MIPYEHQSYVVVRVTRDALDTPDWLVDQKAATLLAELEHGKRTGRADALDFLRTTFEAYGALKKLERLHELAHRPTLTGPEERRLAELRADPDLVQHLNGAATAAPDLRTS